MLTKYGRVLLQKPEIKDTIEEEIGTILLIQTLLELHNIPKEYIDLSKYKCLRSEHPNAGVIAIEKLSERKRN